MAKKKPDDIAFQDETGQMFMLNKKERQLLRELLAKVIKSVSGRKAINEKLGPEYVKIGLNLLKQMGGS
jgi:altronate dehydratase